MRFVNIHFLDKTEDGSGKEAFVVFLDSSTIRYKSMYYIFENSSGLADTILNLLISVIEKYDYTSCRLSVFSDEKQLNCMYSSGVILDKLYDETPDLAHRDLWKELIDMITSRSILLAFENTKYFCE